MNMTRSNNSLYSIGKRTPRIDVYEQVTGNAQYLPDLKIPNMLHGAVLRSPIPHGRILNVDTSKAERVPGVKTILTSSDFPGTKLGFYMGVANKECLVSDKVRFIGDDIAAVAAESEEAALEACALIDVEIEPLPAVFDPEAALERGAPLLHADSPGNIAGEIHKEFGDVTEGFANSDRIFEATFTTSAQAHCCLETRGTVVEADARGNLTVWTTTQIPHVLREILGMVLGIPVGKIRVRPVFVGGGFGSRQSSDPIDPICAQLAIKSRRPVRLIKKRLEEFYTDRYRYPMTIDLKTGVRSDGRIMATHASILTDGGAYHDQGLAITGYALNRVDHCYRIPAVKLDGKVVFTNKVYGGAYRGYGNPQMTFAIESQMDEIAEELGIEPLELRTMNAVQEGDVCVGGSRISSCGLTETLVRGAAAADWKEKRGKKGNRGIGMASFVHSGGGGAWAHGGNFSSAMLKVEYDGSVDLITGIPDVGQGSNTVLALIAAEVLGVDVQDIRVHSGDTGITPVSLGVRGSRETYLGGNAVKLAAEQARDELVGRAAEMLQAAADELECGNGKIFLKSSPDRFVTVAQAAAKTVYETASAFPMGTPVLSTACYVDPLSEMPDKKTGYGNPSPTYAFGTQFAEVEVDTETGEVTVIHMVAAQDVGKALNPMAVEGQLEGALAQGIGLALSERMVWEEGVLKNPNLTAVGLPTIVDLPKMTTILIETDDEFGPFGAKGIGEAGLIPAPAAIANAIYDAVGVRIRELPITAEKVLAALDEKRGR